MRLGPDRISGSRSTKVGCATWGFLHLRTDVCNNLVNSVLVKSQAYYSGEIGTHDPWNSRAVSYQLNHIDCPVATLEAVRILCFSSGYCDRFINVKFASGIKNIHFVFYPHTHRCVLALYTCLLSTRTSYLLIHPSTIVNLKTKWCLANFSWKLWDILKFVPLLHRESYIIHWYQQQVKKIVDIPSSMKHNPV